MIILGLEYKLSTLPVIKTIDLKSKPFITSLKPVNENYAMKDLLLLAAKNNAKYALVAKFVENKEKPDIKISFQLYNLQISEVIESWDTTEDCFSFEDDKFSINIDPFNLFLRDCSAIIINKLDLEIDEKITKFLNTRLINNLDAYIKLVKAKKVTKWVDEKITFLEESIKLDPKCTFSYAEIARIYKNSKKFDEAISSYKKAIETSSSNIHKALYSNELGLCYALNKSYQEAFDSWEEATEFDPGFINPYMNLALTYEEKGAYIKAEQYFLEIQRIDPKDCRTYLNLARLYSKTGNWLKAIDQYKNQLKVNPYDAWSHSNIGNCFLQLDQKKEAKTFFYKTVDLDPDGEAGTYANQVLESLEESSKRDWWRFWKK